MDKQHVRGAEKLIAARAADEKLSVDEVCAASLLMLCREIDKTTGSVAVYPVQAEVTDGLIFNLRVRQSINQDLYYFVTTKAHYDGNKDAITRVLKRRVVTDAGINRVGGLVRLY